MDDQLGFLKLEELPLFPPELTVGALRDSRYASTAYAISELIDNSIEARANHIQLLCAEEYELVVERTKRRVSEIAVLDNGHVMNARTLVEALRFGGGTRHRSTRGMGKYGMGLPTSSLSQCKRVDVWTWQAGLESAWHSAVDVDEILAGRYTVPMPDQSPVPNLWRNAGNAQTMQSKQGTLVVWSRLDKIQWKTSGAIIKNTKEEIGRIHRHFINSGVTQIETTSFSASNPTDRITSFVVPNDPTYMMANSATPPPWNNTPMFREWFRKSYDIPVEDKDQTIEVMYSIVKPEALRTGNVNVSPGSQPHGRHARRNVGVSVVRENREIVLEDAFMREGGGAGDPRQRWWGCEVRFDRGSDELFGVDINKQMAAKFTQAAKTLARDDSDIGVILDELGIESEPIHELVADIRQQIRAMMREIDRMFGQRRAEPSDSGRRNPEHKAITTTSKAHSAALETGEDQPSKTDIDRSNMAPKEREESLTLELIESGRPADDARTLAQGIVQNQEGYLFNAAQVPGYLMFDVRSSNGVLNINLNTEHEIYDLINSVERDIQENADENDPAFQAAVAIRILLLCWAQMEDQTGSPGERMQIQNIASNWGRHVDRVIKQLRDRTL